MSGISTGVGLISGINSSQLISQLLAIDARPKALAQTRVATLQKQQAAYLDLTSRLGALKTASQAFRLNKIFQSATATSSNKDALTATASSNASPGSYTFLVDRLATSQQLLSRGFADRSTSSVGLTSVTVESGRARLDSETDLAAFNGGDGVARGKIVVTDGSGATATVDLSRAATVNDVLDAVNSNTTVRVRASVRAGGLVLTDLSGGNGTFRVVSAASSTTAESLGIAKTGTGGVITGDNVYTIGDNTSLQSLNDGNGIRFNTAAGTTATPDFTVVTSDGATWQVDIGDIYDAQAKKIAGQVNTIGELRTRIESQTEGAVTLAVRSDGRGLELHDLTGGGGSFTVTSNSLSGAAVDLGITGTGTAGIITGKSVLAGLNSVLSSSLNGGQGLSSGVFNVSTHDGSSFSLTLDTTASLSSIIEQISSGTGGKLTAALGSNGNSLVLTDTTSGGSLLSVTGAGATALGVSTSHGLLISEIRGTRIGRQYVTESTLLSTFNGGAGIGTGSFQITGVNGVTSTVSISASARTVGDVVQQINSAAAPAGVKARINDSGTGIVVEKDPSATGSLLISIKDSSGTVARSLNLVGTASAANQNYVDGSSRRTITIDAADTLDTVQSKINSAKAGVNASIISDGGVVAPYRLKFNATQAGRAGRVIIESAGADLALSNVGAGLDAKVFVGADDPAQAILITRSANTLTGVVDGVTIGLQSTTSAPVTVTVARDDSAITKAVQDFVDAFNGITGRIRSQSTYDSESKTSGVLLGDSTASTLQAELFATINRAGPGLTGRYTRLSQIGITVGSGGTLRLDSAKFASVLAEDPQAVEELLAAQVRDDKPATVPIDGITGVTVSNTAADTYSVLGMGEVLAQLVEKYTDSTTGVLSNRSRGVEDAIRFQNDRIKAFDVRLATKRSRLERQFAAMEQALARLQAQQSTLSSIGSLG